MHRARSGGDSVNPTRGRILRSAGVLLLITGFGIASAGLAHAQGHQQHSEAPAHAEPSHAEPSRAEPSRAEPSRAEPSRAEPSHAEPSRAEPSHAEPSRAEPSHAEPSHAEPSHAQPSHAEPSHAEPSRAAPSHAEPSHAEPSRAAPSHAEPSHAEPSRAEPNRAGPNQHFDARYNHNRAYPVHGTEVRTLPSGHSSLNFHGTPYYVHDGVYYRPHGDRFIVVAPPVGLIVPFLPAYYSTVWWAGTPYYYANDTYYTSNPGANGYVVAQPPQGIESATAQSSGDVYAYPANGQSPDQQATDRYECHQYAVQQTGFDPAQPPANAPPDASNDYTRAESACLEGRGYSVQ
jgi:hypothetical protein